MLLTCDDEGVRDGRLGQHALHVAAEELQSLSAPAVGVHQDHDPAWPPHLGVRDAWCSEERQGELVHNSTIILILQKKVSFYHSQFLDQVKYDTLLHFSRDMKA